MRAIVVASALLCTSFPVTGHTVVVAQDGSGDYTSVQAAITASAAGDTITVKKGAYHEVITVPSSKARLTIRGATGDPADVVIDFDNASGTKKPDGSTYGTSGSATATIAANDFTARYLTFSNSFNRAKHPEITAQQAVAVKTTADRLVFDHDRFLGHQDTLYADTASVSTPGRQYYVDSTIVGDVDFMFGRATAVFAHDTITALDRGGDPNGYLTAASTRADNPRGFLISDSTVTSGAAAATFYLGRPWHPGGDVNAVAQVTIRNTWLPAAIKPTPWTDMSGFSWRDARFGEYHNTGPGAGIGADRPQLTDAQAAGRTARAYLAGSDGWNPT